MEIEDREVSVFVRVSTGTNTVDRWTRSACRHAPPRLSFGWAINRQMEMIEMVKGRVWGIRDGQR